MKNRTPIYVAVADDHPIVRQGLITLLQAVGIQTIAEGKNGRELISNIEESELLPQVCLIDIMMPELDGYDTAKIISKKWPTINILAFTMFYNEYSVVKMIANGARGYLLKAASIEEIYKAIIEVNEVGYYYSELEIAHLKQEKNTGHLEQYLFSDKEQQFIRLCCSELTYKEIASKMNTSLSAIDTYRSNLFLKLNLQSRVGLVMFAIKAGLVSF